MKSIDSKEREEKKPASGTLESDKIALRPEQPTDEPFVFRLFTDGRPDLEWITGIDQERKRELLLRQFQYEQEQLRKNYPDAEHSIILLDGNTVGRLYLHRGEKEYRILVITLAPEYRGRGIGRNLIKNILREAAAAGSPVGLQVAWYNRPARAFYERMGFLVTEDIGIYCEMQWMPEIRLNK